MTTNENHFIFISDDIKQKMQQWLSTMWLLLTKLRSKLCQSEYENPIIGICRLPEYGRNWQAAAYGLNKIDSYNRILLEWLKAIFVTWDNNRKETRLDLIASLFQNLWSLLF
jgi:hypothetical protein